MCKYLFIFSQRHQNFRAPEFLSICELFSIHFNRHQLSSARAVSVIDFEFENDVRQIISRSILIKYAIELVSYSQSSSGLLNDIKSKQSFFKQFDDANQTFAIKRYKMGKRPSAVSSGYCGAEIEELALAISLENSRVDLNNAKTTFMYIEEYYNSQPLSSNSIIDKEFYFGRLIGEGQSQLKHRYNLQQRRYIGNTTMDPELSFIQANLIKANIGSVVLDPFCGTGGLIISAAHFGAAVLGTEINYNIARAIGKSSRMGQTYLTSEQSVAANFSQYSLDDRFLGILLSDASVHELWRSSISSGRDSYRDGFIDAIISDPPYGIREKSRKIAVADDGDDHILSAVLQSTNKPRFPKKSRYEMCATFLDLLNLGARLLVIHGRLSFWFPMIEEDCCDDVLPRHDAFRLVANCKHCLATQYSRLLLVYEKCRSPNDSEKAYFVKNCYEHVSFKQRVFRNC